MTKSGKTSFIFTDYGETKRKLNNYMLGFFQGKSRPDLECDVTMSSIMKVFSRFAKMSAKVPVQSLSYIRYLFIMWR